jgi:hypothetical protein
MIQLNKKDYHKATIPLRQVTFNNLFARSVVEQHVTGTVYADSTSEPRAFYIIHPYGMALLFGDHNNEKFNSALLEYILNNNKIRKRIEWLQVYPGKWNALLSSLLGENLLIKKDHKSPEEIKGNAKVIQNTRINFKFNPGRYRKFKESLPADNYEIVRTDFQMFNDMQGSVVPKYFWDNENHFLTNGVGFSLKYNNDLAYNE